MVAADMAGLSTGHSGWMDILDDLAEIVIAPPPLQVTSYPWGIQFSNKAHFWFPGMPAGLRPTGPIQVFYQLWLGTMCHPR
jgi:hypothetical protein